MGGLCDRAFGDLLYGLKKREGGASEKVDGEYGNEATPGEYASDYVSYILKELEKWQYVGPASHSFVRLKQRVEQAILEE